MPEDQVNFDGPIRIKADSRLSAAAFHFPQPDERMAESALWRNQAFLPVCWMVIGLSVKWCPPEVSVSRWRAARWT